MDFAKFLSENWSQIVVILGASGYIIKLFLDFNIKKKEIRFTHVFKEKASNFQDFSASYYELVDKLIKLSYEFKSGLLSFKDFEIALNGSKDELRLKFNSLIMYCNKKERETLFSIINSFTFVLYKIKDVDVDNVEKILLDNLKANANKINKFTLIFRA